jgi:hypothetical protein
VRFNQVIIFYISPKLLLSNIHSYPCFKNSINELWTRRESRYIWVSCFFPLLFLIFSCRCCCLIFPMCLFCKSVCYAPVHVIWSTQSLRVVSLSDNLILSFFYEKIWFLFQFVQNSLQYENANSFSKTSDCFIQLFNSSKHFKTFVGKQWISW